MVVGSWIVVPVDVTSLDVSGLLASVVGGAIIVPDEPGIESVPPDVSAASSPNVVQSHAPTNGAHSEPGDSPKGSMPLIEYSLPITQSRPVSAFMRRRSRQIARAIV